MSAAVASLLFLAVLVWPFGMPQPRPGRLPARRGGAETGETRDDEGDLTGDEDDGARAGLVEAGSGAAPLEADVDPGQVATAMDLLALALRSGSGVPESIDVVAAEVGGAVGGQLRVVSAALRWGLDEQTAWASLPRVWTTAGRAMGMAGLAGVPPADLLAAAATDLRRAEEARLEIAAARLGVALVVPLGLAFLPAFVLLTVLPLVLGLAGQVLSGN